MLNRTKNLGGQMVDSGTADTGSNLSTDSCQKWRKVQNQSPFQVPRLISDGRLFPGLDHSNLIFAH